MGQPDLLSRSRCPARFTGLTSNLSAWAYDRPTANRHIYTRGRPCRHLRRGQAEGRVEVRYAAENFVVLWDHLCKHTAPVESVAMWKH